MDGQRARHPQFLTQLKTYSVISMLPNNIMASGQPIFLSWLQRRKIVVLTSGFGSLFLRKSGEKEVSERVRLNQEFDFKIKCFLLLALKGTN